MRNSRMQSYSMSKRKTIQNGHDRRKLKNMIQEEEDLEHFVVVQYIMKFDW